MLEVKKNTTPEIMNTLKGSLGYGVWLRVSEHKGITLDKIFGEIRNTRDIPKCSKDNIQQANSQHQIKWREDQSNSTKIMNKTRLFILYSYSIEYLKF